MVIFQGMEPPVYGGVTICDTMKSICKIDCPLVQPLSVSVPQPFFITMGHIDILIAFGKQNVLGTTPLPVVTLFSLLSALLD